MGKMLWSRTDVDEDFDKNVLLLSRLRPLSGKGFYTTLRNLIYMQAPEPYTLTPDNWRDIKLAMPISRAKFNEMLDVCMGVGLFDQEHFKATGEITSRRIQQEISGRFGDLNRAQRKRDKDRDSSRDGDRDDGCDSDRDSHRISPPTVTQVTVNSKQRTGYRRHGRSSSAPSNGSRVADAVQLDQEAMARLHERGEEITREAVNAEIEAMKAEGAKAE